MPKSEDENGEEPKLPEESDEPEPPPQDLDPGLEIKGGKIKPKPQSE